MIRCVHCGEPIERYLTLTVTGTQWIHKSDWATCGMGSAKGLAGMDRRLTKATPPSGEVLIGELQAIEVELR